MTTNEISFTAPAKLNLYLHVTGRRPDGYHLLDSLFVFVDFGDVVKVYPDGTLSLETTGAYGSVLAAASENIVLKAAMKLADCLGITPCGRIILEKNLPVASGIGGGSSDAAAVLKALQKLWGRTLPDTELYALALSLGADVPACLAGKPVQVSGIGENLCATPDFPKMPVLLVNPNKPVSTPEVFKHRSGEFSLPMPFVDRCRTPEEFAKELLMRRNDLTEAACAVEPEVRRVLDELGGCPDCLMSRMSGSGGTCFCLFKEEEAVLPFKAFLQEKHPEWWVQNAKVV